jgi:hypothetical protein
MNDPNMTPCTICGTKQVSIYGYSICSDCRDTLKVLVKEKQDENNSQRN